MLRPTHAAAIVVLATVGCGAGDAPPAATATQVADAAAVDTIFVSAEWLAAHSGADDIVIVHVGTHDDYYEARIPGAGLITPGDLNEERDGVPNMLAPAQRLVRGFAAAGVRGDERVVVYGAPLAAARAFVALERLGHARASILDGGLAAWQAAGGSVEDGPSPEPTPSDLRLTHDDELIVDAVWVRERLDDAAYALIDARPPGEHRGEVEAERVPRPGHIPGSTNLFWERLIESREQPRLRADDELHALFDEAGAADGRTLVVYCRTGMQSSFAYAVARHLGHRVRIYDGSFADWSRRRDLPVER
jgi:thiosulfate/3-mercaptopyruvate sulfurtransferase